jgi:ankyrin repeat protein
VYGGDTALHLAVRCIEESQAENIVVKLLQLGADPSATNENHRTAADEAQRLQHRFMADVLSGRISIDKAVTLLDQRALERRGERFVEAVRDGNLERVNALIDHDVINYVSKNGWAAIHYVITHCPISKCEILTTLIDRGADVNIVNIERDTALNLTIKNNLLRTDDSLMYKLAERLLQADAQFDVKDTDGHDAFDLARSRQYDDIVQLLEAVALSRMPPEEQVKVIKPEPVVSARITNTQILFEAVSKHGLVEITKAVELPEVDVNSFNASGLAPAHVVIGRNDIGVDEKISALKCLLEHGANVNAVCQRDGNSLLHILATNITNMTVIQYLVRSNIDLSIKNKAGETAYDVAMRAQIKDKNMKKTLATVAANRSSSAACLVS